MKEWKKSRTLTAALRHAKEGLFFVIQEEANIRRQLSIGALVLILAIIVSVPLTHFLILVLVSALVISLEMVNAAIEWIEDVVNPEYHTAVKRSKDIAAAAVLVSSLAAILIGILVFIPPFLTFIG
jgi:diacylglycerol kinase